MKRFSVIVDGWSDLPIGQQMNAVATVIGGLRCDGFAEKIAGADGNWHAAIRFNMPILKAKKAGDFVKVANIAKQLDLELVVFCREAQQMSNSFGDYKNRVQQDSSLSIIAMAVYGADEAVRKSVKFLSVFT